MAADTKDGWRSITLRSGKAYILCVVFSLAVTSTISLLLQGLDDRIRVVALWVMVAALLVIFEANKMCRELADDINRVQRPPDAYACPVAASAQHGRTAPTQRIGTPTPSFVAAAPMAQLPRNVPSPTMNLRGDGSQHMQPSAFSSLNSRMPSMGALTL